MFIDTMFFTIDHNHPTFINLLRSHAHDSLEITLFLSNGGTFLVGGQLFPIRRGTLVVIQGGTSHYCIADISSFNRYSIRIPDRTLEEISSLQTDFKTLFGENSFSMNLSAEQTDHLTALIDNCISCESGFGADFQKYIYFFQIVLYIGKLQYLSPREKDPAFFRDYKKIIPALQYIHENYSEEITIQQLSNLCFLSKYYLSHIFYNATGFNVKSYITNYRIRQACELFNQGLSVQDAGLAVGFSNSAYFIQVFKRIVGTTPGNLLRSRQSQ